MGIKKVSPQTAKMPVATVKPATQSVTGRTPTGPNAKMPMTTKPYLTKKGK
jgi:hypothetical protein